MPIMERAIDNWNYYWKLGLDTVKELETDRGILASGREELYGAIFGRDSLITSLKLLSVYKQTRIEDFRNTVKKVLLTLTELQGREVNIESGEEPGKCIHEYRPERHEHLTRDLSKPWYLYPDKVMRNYDTVDATPLFLIAAYRYYQASNDEYFINRILPNINLALRWILDWGDSNGDGFIDYAAPANRRFGGLINHNWMDSIDSVFHEDGSEVIYPIAPVEVQAYTYLALKLWEKYFSSHLDPFYLTLNKRARELKNIFNEQFILSEGSPEYLASAIDGRGKTVTSVRSSMGHTFWASLTMDDDGEVEGILESVVADDVVKRLMAPDMFEPDAGIRTLSSLSSGYKPNSYHNGSIWPHDNSMIAEGFDNYGYFEEAERVRRALLKAVSHFKTPIELFVYEKDYQEYQSPRGQTACKLQAWTAASLLSSVASNYEAETRTKIDLELDKLFPYKLVGFKLKHAVMAALLVDKIKVKDKFKLSSLNISDILKVVAQIGTLNSLEKLRHKGLVPYLDNLKLNNLGLRPSGLKQSLPFQVRFTLLGFAEREKDHFKSVIKRVREKLEL